jgi:hypothetical protein
VSTKDAPDASICDRLASEFIISFKAAKPNYLICLLLSCNYLPHHLLACSLSRAITNNHIDFVNSFCSYI